jgi:hypothetical protein
MVLVLKLHLCLRTCSKNWKYQQVRKLLFWLLWSERQLFRCWLSSSPLSSREAPQQAFSAIFQLYKCKLTKILLYILEDTFQTTDKYIIWLIIISLFFGTYYKRRVLFIVLWVFYGSVDIHSNHTVDDYKSRNHSVYDFFELGIVSSIFEIAIGWHNCEDWHNYYKESGEKKLNKNFFWGEGES